MIFNKLADVFQHLGARRGREGHRNSLKWLGTCCNPMDINRFRSRNYYILLIISVIVIS